MICIIAGFTTWEWMRRISVERDEEVVGGVLEAWGILVGLFIKSTRAFAQREWECERRLYFLMNERSHSGGLRSMLHTALVI